ncbi:SAP30-binding protein [Aricia agestis]|uniref:SAP30-binding protein n=1 Tax=Aricia agestis TaxID=91739 RepID=UPI001C20A198|nr:SAP30-binding protein [Aricia agestis]
MTSQALASLTATYTDSEGEEDMEDGQQTPDKDEGNERGQSAPVSPKNIEENKEVGSAPGSPKRTARLVSYVDDTIVSDEEQLSPTAENQDDMRRLSMETDTDEAVPKSDPDDSQDGVSIPPEPAGKCPKELQDTIAKFYSRMMTEGLDMNRIIQDKKNFRNPSIYEKLIQFCDINELDTNYPPEIYDPLRWGKESYYDELARVQKVEMDRREKERKEKFSKIDFISGVSKKADSDDDKKRKSKWDQAAPNVSKLNIKQPGLVQQSLTTNVTGTKGTVISAFGAIAKKPKL